MTWVKVRSGQDRLIIRAAATKYTMQREREKYLWSYCPVPCPVVLFLYCILLVGAGRRNFEVGPLYYYLISTCG
jgi:hypothetical protein